MSTNVKLWIKFVILLLWMDINSGQSHGSEVNSHSSCPDVNQPSAGEPVMDMSIQAWTLVCQIKNKVDHTSLTVEWFNVTSGTCEDICTSSHQNGIEYHNEMEEIVTCEFLHSHMSSNFSVTLPQWLYDQGGHYICSTKIDGNHFACAVNLSSVPPRGSNSASSGSQDNGTSTAEPPDHNQTMGFGAGFAAGFGAGFATGIFTGAGIFLLLLIRHEKIFRWFIQKYKWTEQPPNNGHEMTPLNSTNQPEPTRQQTLASSPV